MMAGVFGYTLRLVSELRVAAQHRLLGAALALLTVVFSGTIGYRYIGGGGWSWGECLYMTIITLSTVGYAETLRGMNQQPFAREFTLLLIVFGSGTLLYFVSTLTAFIVEGQFRGALRRNRMRQRIDKLEQHVVLCGVGTTGEYVVRELMASKVPFVAIDADEERLERLAEEHGPGFLYLAGDATEDHVLEEGGIGRARAVIAALHDDKDNLFVVITARSMNAQVRIVSRAVESGSIPKIERAGANAVVSPNHMGGLRLVNEVLRPHVVRLVDQLILDNGEALTIGDLEVPEGSAFDGVRLRDAGLRKMDVLVIAIRRSDGSFQFNPPADAVLEANTTLIVLARNADIASLREGVRSGRPPR